MTDANFTSLLSGVQNQRRANARSTAIRNALANTSYYFTTSQAMQLIQSVSSETNRLEFARSAYPKITDPANFTQVYNLFYIQSNKDALAAYVNSYNNNNTGYNNNNNNNGGTQYNTAMTDADFNATVLKVKQQWLPGAKLSALNDIFANVANYFTTYQAKQLIQLVSDEDNRLQLAKSAYRNLVDPSNFTQLYDLFTTQARKDALANYISSYSYNRQ
jgi:hypothetical protein